MQAKGLVDESMQCEVSGSHRWQQIAHLLSLGPDQMNSLVALRTSMNSRSATPPPHTHVPHGVLYVIHHHPSRKDLEGHSKSSNTHSLL